MFNIGLLILLCIVYVSQSQFYSPRTKCSANDLSFDSQLALFYQNTQFSNVSYTQIIDVMGMLNPLFHYGYKVDQPIIQNHRCQNYFIQKQICCRYSDLDIFTQKLADLYRRTYFKSKHPIIDYIYKIYDQYKKITSINCFDNFNFRIPDRDGFTKENSSPIITDLIVAIQNQIKAIKQHEINFIYNSACVLCVGIKDMKTFLHPIHTDLKKSERLIYNKQYFTNVTTMVANAMLNSKNYADQIQLYIQNQLKPKLVSNLACDPLKNMIINTTQIIKRKVCDSFQRCLKFAQKFIGQAGAPAYSKMFNSVQLKRGITRTNYKVITSGESGFKSNYSNYNRYLSNSPPPVQIKGNQYLYA